MSQAGCWARSAGTLLLAVTFGWAGFAAMLIGGSALEQALSTDVGPVGWFMALSALPFWIPAALGLGGFGWAAAHAFGFRSRRAAVLGGGGLAAVACSLLWLAMVGPTYAREPLSDQLFLLFFSLAAGVGGAIAGLVIWRLIYAGKAAR